MDTEKYYLDIQNGIIIIQEKEYLEQIKLLYKNELNKEKIEEKEEFKGFLLSKKLIKDSQRVCLKCNEYSFESKDDVYMNKYRCCYKCYIKYVEGIGREEAWLKKIHRQHSHLFQDIPTQNHLLFL